MILEVNTILLNVRAHPSLTVGSIIGTLRKGDLVEKLMSCGEGYWFLVKSDNITGWCSSKYLSEVKEPKSMGWFEIAKSQIGTKEIPGDEHNPQIIKYLKSTTLHEDYASQDETPWCSAFVNWCIEEAGYAGTDSAWARHWLNWGYECEPIKGCIVVLSRGSGGHVGFLAESLKIKMYPGNIQVLGGNQNNAVNISNYPGTRLLGFRMI